MSPVWKKRLRNIAGPTLATILFVGAIRLLIGEAKQISWEEFRAAVVGVPRIYLLIAALLIAMNYAMLMAYDLLALRYLRRSLPLRRVALVGFLGYSLGNNLGTLIAAAPLRFHFYTRWGLSPTQIVALIAFLGLTFWSGLWFLGGTVLVFNPIPLPADVRLPIGTRSLGFVMLSMWIAYALSCAVWHKPIPIGGLKLRTPHIGLMGLQTSVAAVDLTISATALYLVLPADTIVPFSLVLAAYLVAIAIALITQVPGGLGVLELILLKLLAGTVGQTVLASVLIFRVMYYVLPLLVGILLMVVNELWEGAEQMRAANRKVAPPSELTADRDVPPEGELPELDELAKEDWENHSSPETDS